MMVALKSIANTLAILGAFQVGRLRKGNQQVEWLPILECDKGGYYLGLTANGCWVVEAYYDLVLLDNSEQYYCLISLLENSYEDVIRKLRRFESKFDNKIDVVSVFPFVEIVRAGLEQGSDYWARLAFDWYDKLIISQKQLIKDVLDDVIVAKWASQKVRQKAKKEQKVLNNLNSM